MYKDSFDNNLKSIININNCHITPSKNIFEEAWKKKDNVENKKFYFLKPRKSIIAASICFIMLSCVTTLCISENARAFAKEAYNNLRTIFVLEKSGNDYKIVEKPEDSVTFNYSFGCILITDSNKKDCENRLGFSIYLPEKIGKDFEIHTNGGLSDRTLSLRVYDIKLNDAENLQNKFFEFIKNNSETKEIRGYKKKFHVYSFYSALHGPTYLLSIDKIDNLTKKRTPKDIVKEFNIEDVKCQVCECPQGYTDSDGYLHPTYDCKAKPDKIIKCRSISWEYNGIKFCLGNTTHDPLDIDNAAEFIKDYMKGYKAAQ